MVECGRGKGTAKIHLWYIFATNISKLSHFEHTLETLNTSTSKVEQGKTMFLKRQAHFPETSQEGITVLPSKQPLRKPALYSAYLCMQDCTSPLIPNQQVPSLFSKQPQCNDPPGECIVAAIGLPCRANNQPGFPVPVANNDHEIFTIKLDRR